jgi:HK97 family phage major capsid protein
MQLHDLEQKRAAAVAAMRAIQDRSEKEGKRALTSEETEAWERADKEQDEIGKQIAEARKEADRVKRLEALEAESRSYTKPPVAVATNSTAAETRSVSELRTAAFDKYLMDGRRAQFTDAELRALQSDLPTSGGFLRPDEQFVNELIKSIDDMVFIRAISRKFTVTDADGIGAPALDADPDDASWTAEIGAVSEDSTMAFGKRELKPNQLTKLVKVSRKLLRKTAGGAGSLVSQRLGYKFGVTEEKAFLTGTGAGQPLGVFTASSDGISTSRDVSTDNTATAITGDGLINALMSLKEGYQRNARWILHRDTVKAARKLKDAVNGQYLWQPGLNTYGSTGLNERMPVTGDTLLGKPIHMSEYAPNTFTTGLYVGIVGDFSYYWIVDALTFELQRLEELYAGNSQVGFIGRMEMDAMPVLGEAFARVTLA